MVSLAGRLSGDESEVESTGFHGIGIKKELMSSGRNGELIWLEVNTTV